MDSREFIAGIKKEKLRIEIDLAGMIQKRIIEFRETTGLSVTSVSVYTGEIEAVGVKEPTPVVTRVSTDIRILND